MNDLPKENQNYDAGLVWILSYNCNLNCSYCFQDFLINKGLISKKISKIDISALQKTLSETNKIFKIDLGGGEPFLIPNIIEACSELTKNHFVSIFTNLTSEKVKEFVEKINPERVSLINASLHIKELEKHKLLDKYISNFHKLKKNGFNIKAVEVADPHIINEVKKYKKFFKKKGISLEFMPFVGKYKGKIYPASYTEKELKVFGINKKQIAMYYQKGNFCHGGYDVVFADPKGDLFGCAYLKKKIGNVYEKIRFNDNISRCPFEFCPCGLDSDLYLYKKAIRETKSPNS
ncbi:MAG: radical SAM protein [Promethearchaeota archaeon]|nr:MAG: radical SAM protein [Candidatus Lokiarchaeota archaeon]